MTKVVRIERAFKLGFFGVAVELADSGKIMVNKFRFKKDDPRAMKLVRKLRAVRQIDLQHWREPNGNGW